MSKRCSAIRHLFRTLIARTESLELKMERVRNDMHRAADSSVFFCSQPLQAALSRKIFLAILFTLALLYFRVTLAWCQRLLVNGRTCHDRFRFSVLRTRNDSARPLVPPIDRFGLLADGADVAYNLADPVRVVKEEVDDEMNLVVTYNRHVAVNGFYFVTGQGPPGSDPVEFLVHGGRGEGGWKLIGGSGHKLDWLKTDAACPIAFSFFPSFYNTTEQRRAVEMFDFQPPTFQSVVLVLLNLTRFSILFVPVVLGLLELEYLGKLWMQQMTAVLGVMILSFAMLDKGNVASQASNACLVFFVSCTLRFFDDEKVFWRILLVLFSFWSVLGFVLGRTLIMVVGTMIALFSAFVLIHRRSYIGLAWRFHKEEQDWLRDVVRQFDMLEGRAEAKERLRQLIGNISSSSPSSSFSHVCLQQQPPSPTPATGKLARDKNRFSSSSLVFLRSLVPETLSQHVNSSLDRLYAQAACTDSVLRDKVQRWAAGSGGLLLSRREDGRVRYRRVDSCACHVREQVVWEELKRTKRAMEKAILCYGGNAARLVDISRQRIVFDEYEDVARCLELIRGDPDTKVVRLKDRMSREEGEGRSSELGRGDVVLNLQFQEAVLPGVRGHICELQLVLRVTAELETNESHEKYLLFRNLRGK